MYKGALQLNRNSMFRLVKLLLISLIFINCGKNKDTAGASVGECANSPIVGTWERFDFVDTITFAPSCEGSSTLCGSRFKYPNVTATFGSALINVTQNTHPDCSVPGFYTCNYAITDGLQLAYDCGLGLSIYNRLN